MINKLRARMQDEKGFTLIELLVVILIIGILAAIALPAFLNQREKAQDSTAKSDARTAQTAMETYFTDNQSYEGATKEKLIGIEPALGNATTLDVGTPTATSYTITVTSAGANKVQYSITNTAGVVSRACDKADKGGCGTSKKW
jgi:type IV pilus assembly protein PilA